jgi:hypothetical protein
MSTKDNTPRVRWRSLATHAPALIISVMALAFSLGGAAYASTQLIGGATGVTFHPITLINGWKSDQSMYDSGNPSVGIENGVVYLSGSLTQPSGGNEQFATLPPADRPAHDIWIIVYTLSGTSGTVQILHTGVAFASSNTACTASLNDAQCFTSLAGISYPVNS